ARRGSHRQRARENRSERGREFAKGASDRRDRCGFYFRRRHDPLGARRRYRAGFLLSMTVDAKILSALREADETGITGAMLAVKAGVSSSALTQRVAELCRIGYDIEATPHLGYRLLSAPDVLHADDLLSRLGPRRI